MANPKIHICGHPKIHVPDDDCSECIRELNLFKEEVHDSLDGKQDKLTAGANITIDENNVISASGGGGGSMTKAEILAALGYEETTISMTDVDDNEVEIVVLTQIPTP